MRKSENVLTDSVHTESIDPGTKENLRKSGLGGSVKTACPVVLASKNGRGAQHKAQNKQTL